MTTILDDMAEEIRRHRVRTRMGRVLRVASGHVEVAGLSRHCRLGDIVTFADGAVGSGEIVAVTEQGAVVMPFDPNAAFAIGDRVALAGSSALFPSAHWVGRLIDAEARPLDGRKLRAGSDPVAIRARAPDAGTRKSLGPRVATGVAALDTLLPLVRGQRIGIFAGSGVGKTSLLGRIAQAIEADCVVIGLIGERGREVRDFIDRALGPRGMARSVVVAATSDQSPLLKRRAAWTATAIAEHFRDEGKHVLLMIDSLTRFAEAHREVALTAGEPPSLRAYPPSTASLIAGLAERAGPGAEGSGDNTAIYSVLVAGSDMEEPVADIARGVLDGHVILDREIAERGRFPAIDVRRSVSRSLPDAATEEENALIETARAMLAKYESSEALIQTGLYTPGTDPDLDRAVRIWPDLDRFIARTDLESPEEAFAALGAILAA